MNLNVKEGDEVALHTDHYGSLKLTTVARVTPTGIIVLANGDQYRPDGTERGGRGWNRTRIELLTPELRAKAIRQQNIAFFKGIKPENLDDETLAQVVSLVRVAQQRGVE